MFSCFTFVWSSFNILAFSTHLSSGQSYTLYPHHQTNTIKNLYSLPVYHAKITSFSCAFFCSLLSICCVEVKNSMLTREKQRQRCLFWKMCFMHFNFVLISSPARSLSLTVDSFQPVWVLVLINWIKILKNKYWSHDYKTLLKGTVLEFIISVFPEHFKGSSFFSPTGLSAVHGEKVSVGITALQS